MSEVKDPKIKLFGRTIELQEAADVAAESCEDVEEDCSNQDPPSSPNSMVEDDNTNGGVDEEEHESHESPPGIKPTDAIDEDQAQPLTSEELKESNVIPMTDDDSKAVSAETDTEAVKASKSEEDQNDASNSEEKTLKKPDKILPCPRCNSMETKFCYFNNYNVNQPRHFCKKCQRYWTAGGTMRNVPVGAGRRKNKNTPPQFRHLTTPEMLQNARVDLPNGVLNPNGTVLTFSSDTPLCESMTSALNIADQTIRNGFSQPEEVGISVSHGSKENGDDGSSGSSVSAASSVDEVANCHPFPPQVPFFPGGPWAYPWIAPPTFGPASFPPPYFSTGPAYWACAIPGTWNIPWVIPSASTALTSQAPACSGPNSPTLGKHSRDENGMKVDEGKEEEKQKERNSEKCLWVPKTLRIDDPDEAAKSSIWATLGIKHDRVDSIGGGGLFKAFQSQSKNDEKIHVQETSTVLQANPAALSRSLNFHESS